MLQFTETAVTFAVLDLFGPRIPAPWCHSISLLKPCIPIVNRRSITASVYPKSIFQIMMCSISPIDTFF